MKKVFITGGSGYVGSKLGPYLMDAGYEIVSYDIAPCDWLSRYMGYGSGHAVIADIRNTNYMKRFMAECDTVIHLACISNDPSFDFDPELGKSINYDCFRPMVKAAKESGVKRFIFASSSSVYGVKEEKEVTEDLALTPLTDYSKYKAMCEEVLLEEQEPGFETVIIRPATVCGMSPSLRLDLCVHILTMSALRNNEISVFGGSQYRPNIHIDDICVAYKLLMEAPAEKVDGEIFNCGHQNLTIMETAQMISNVVGGDIKIKTTPTDDIRSYHVSSEKIANVLRFRPYRPIGQAVMELRDYYKNGLIPNPDDEKYYAIKKMKKFL